MDYKIEGYWYSSSEPQYPVPKPRKSPISREFLDKLSAVEAIAEKYGFRGWSTCRCCCKPNGSQEYKFNGWIWPEGFMHYLTEHNVHPTPAFMDMIMKTEACEHKRTFPSEHFGDECMDCGEYIHFDCVEGKLVEKL